MSSLKEMLDLIYEIEGLTELAIRRDPVPEAILPLIADKTFLLNALAQALNTRVQDGQQDDKTTHSDIDIDGAHDHTNTESLPPHIKGAPKSGAADDIKKYFSINDKFRFRRELFINDADEFSRTLDMIMKMASYEDAEEYFYNDLQWDPENEEVMAFMTKVQEFFDR